MYKGSLSGKRIRELQKNLRKEQKKLNDLLKVMPLVRLVSARI